MIEIFLVLFILSSVFLTWYIFQLVKKFLQISDELENLFLLLEEYAEHVDIVYNLERFYGDTTLENLMRHSKTITGAANNFRAIYDVNYELDEEEEYEEEVE